MSTILHITSGDIAGTALAESKLSGDILVWHDILYDGPRVAGWPDGDNLEERAVFLSGITGGGLSVNEIVETFDKQYAQLRNLADDDRVVLWFDGCLFDQSMLVHILSCLRTVKKNHVDLLCIDSFPGIEPYNGLGQLRHDQLLSCYDSRQAVTDDQFVFAGRVDQAFVEQNGELMAELSMVEEAPLPLVPAAIQRWLEESPDAQTGLGKLERLALAAISAGYETPGQIFGQVAQADTPPQYWGDITLWQKINGLADRDPPLVLIEGPAQRLPQWKSELLLEEFRISPVG